VCVGPKLIKIRVTIRLGKGVVSGGHSEKFVAGSEHRKMKTNAYLLWIRNCRRKYLLAAGERC